MDFILEFILDIILGQPAQRANLKRSHRILRFFLLAFVLLVYLLIMAMFALLVFFTDIYLPVKAFFLLLIGFGMLSLYKLIRRFARSL